MIHDEDLPELDSETEATLRARLRELPRPEIPSAVSDRVLSALAAESAQRSAEQNSNVHRLIPRSWIRRVVPVAAAAVVVVVMGFAVWPTINSSETPQTLAAATRCTVSADPGSDFSSVLHATGASYSAAGLTSQAEVMSARPTSGCGSQGDAAGRSVKDESVTADSSQAETELLAKEPGSRRGASPDVSVAVRHMFPAGGGEQYIRSCVVSVLHGRDVEIIDVARFDGLPAVVVVVRGPREVLALDCGMKRSSVIAHESLPAR